MRVSAIHRRFPTWSRDPAVQRGLEAFAGHLLDRNWAQLTVDRYLAHVARGWADPLAYLVTLTSWQGQHHAKNALCLYADYRGQPEAKVAIRAVPSPLRPPRRPVHVPSVERWRAIGHDLLRRHPRELGHVAWVLVYSGLRLSDTLRLSRAQVALASTGATVEMVQKGRGSRRRRTFRPMDEVLFALAWLARVPGWTVLWESFSRSIKSAAQILQRVIPTPHTPHDFRRAFATYLYHSGRDLLTIAQMGGWESAASVERYISIVPEERLVSARRGLSNLLFPKHNPAAQPIRPIDGPGR